MESRAELKMLKIKMYFKSAKSLNWDNEQDVELQFKIEHVELQWNQVQRNLPMEMCTLFICYTWTM